MILSRRTYRSTSLELDKENICIDDNFFPKIQTDCMAVLEKLKKSWGVHRSISFLLDDKQPLSRSRLTDNSDIVLVMQGWNKTLAFRSMFAEAILGRWRVLAATHQIRMANEAQNEINGDRKEASKPENEKAKRRSSLLVCKRELERFSSRMKSLFSAGTCEEDNLPVTIQVLHKIECNKDPIAELFGERVNNLELIVIGLLDCAVRELCPDSQIVQRESYRPILGSADLDSRFSKLFMHENDCKTLDQYCVLFAVHGIKPIYWVSFCEAFVWAMQTHSPYTQEDDIDDLTQRHAYESAYAKFVAGSIALPMIEAHLRRASFVNCDIVEKLKLFCSSEYTLMKSSFFRSFENIVNDSFAQILEEFPHLEVYFSELDRDQMGMDLAEMVLTIVHDACNLTDPRSDVRYFLGVQSKKWKDLEIPIEAFALFGNNIIDAMKLLFSHIDHTSDVSLEDTLAFLYRDAMQFVMYPLISNRKLKDEASNFYTKVGEELKWSPQALQERLFQVNMEISMTGQYTQTGDEIKIGARLAWRNSAKCIGRIAWNTLEVRDRRHITQPRDIFNEVEEHLKLAIGGTHIRSVMTIFRPQHPHEIWGMRFWSCQLLRYAGYKTVSGDILGDPANVDFTSYLISSNLWTPPARRSSFDVLPLVLKLPSNDIPFVHELPQKLIQQVEFEHPNFPEVKSLGYKWVTVPVISNFMMNLGGIKYPCAPFNGWFVSTEICRNLIERYQVSNHLARALKMDLNDPFLPQKVSTELEHAILYSFQRQGITIIDPLTVGKSFITHCKRERNCGRECPAQWSWIGGLVGPTNPTWHLEMRDFLILPKYDYCCNPWQIIDVKEPIYLSTKSNHKCILHEKNNSHKIMLPKVLIGYGSETGNAEAAAFSLARKLKICEPMILSLNKIAASDKLVSGGFTHFFAICSTFGAGNFPENAVRFLTKVSGYNLSCELNYAVLALGSSNYPNFCEAGRALDEILSESGATSLVDVTCVDAVKGNHAPISKWLQFIRKSILPQALLSQIQDRTCTYDGGDSYRMNWIGSEYKSSRGALYPRVFGDEADFMICRENRELINGTNIVSRSTRHIKLKIPEGLKYTSGDHLAVKPLNTLSMVTRFCTCFENELKRAAVTSNTHKFNNTNGSSSESILASSVMRQIQQTFEIGCTSCDQAFLHRADHLTNKTLKEVLEEHVDFSLDHYAVGLLSMLLSRLEKASFTTNTLMRKAQQFTGLVADAINQYNDLGDFSKIECVIHQYPTVVNLLEEYQELFCVPIGCKASDPLISIADVLVLMSRLKPRYYSISSSANSSPNEVSITVGVVNIRNQCGNLLRGVCSNYLASISMGDMISASIVESTFRAPKSASCPVIMVGTGTGLAPFMGFLGDRCILMREASTHSPRRKRRGMFGEWHLYYGCRSNDEILYKDKLVKMQSSGVVHLHLAQSRQKGKPNMYVQDKLLENGKEVARILLCKESAHFYICGDAKVARSCSEACIEILKKFGNMSRLAAAHHIMMMRIKGRWQLDVYKTGDDNDLGLDVDILNKSGHQLNSSRERMMRRSGRVWNERFLHSPNY